MFPDSKLCPQELKESIGAYAERGRPTGSFLRACLENDLKEAVARADDINIELIPHIVSYLYHEIPGPCWGSRENVAAWIEQGGMQGYNPGFLKG